jgi:hypothetical protein
MTEQTGKCAPEARVRQRIIGQSIGIDHGCRMRKDLAQIAFRDAVVDDSRGLKTPRGL